VINIHTKGLKISEITAAKTELEIKINAVKSDVINTHMLGLKKMGKAVKGKITAVKTELETKINAVKSDVIFCQSAETKNLGLFVKKNKTIIRIKFPRAFNSPPQLAYAVVKSRLNSNIDTAVGFDIALINLTARHAEIELQLGYVGVEDKDPIVVIRWMACGK
jgi:hypothetical protein